MANKNNTSFPSCTVTITLTPEARNFLAGTTAGVSHFAIYNDLLDNMAIVDTSFSKRGNIVPLLTGQAESSAHSMSERWKLGRKSMVRILSTMDDLGIIRLHTSRLASISDMLSVDKCQTNDGDICYPDFSNLPPDPQSDEQVQNAEPPTDGTTDNLPTATVPEANQRPSQGMDTDVASEIKAAAPSPELPQSPNQDADTEGSPEQGPPSVTGTVESGDKHKFEHAPSNDSTPSPCVTEHPRQNAGYQRNLFDDIEDENGTI